MRLEVNAVMPSGNAADDVLHSVLLQVVFGLINKYQNSISHGCCRSSVTPKGALPLAMCDASATREGL